MSRERTQRSRFRDARLRAVDRKGVPPPIVNWPDNPAEIVSTADSSRGFVAAVDDCGKRYH
jgi:hypothetical protein